ncbi:hypothetical protein ACFE04_011322 [Oxalis oulophora]
MPPYFCLTLTVASKSLRRDDLLTIAMWNVSNLQGKFANTYDWSSSFTDHEDVFSRISLALFTHGKSKVFTRKASFAFHLVKDNAKHDMQDYHVVEYKEIEDHNSRFELEESNTNQEKWKPQYSKSVWYSFDDSDGKGKTKVFTRKASHGFIPLRYHRDKPIESELTNTYVMC